jgi:DNA-binding CsgD family transcriptional regulator
VIHLFFFWALASLALGLVILTWAALSYQRSRLRFHKVSVVALALLYYHFTLSLALGYFYNNDPAALRSALGRDLCLLYSLQTTPLVALVAFLMIRLFLLLQRERWRRSWLLGFWGFQAAAFMLRVVLAVKGASGALYDAALYASLLVSYFSLIIIALRTQARPFSHLSLTQTLYLKRFGRVIGMIVLLFAAADFLPLLLPLSNPAGSFLSILPVFLLMLAGLLFLERFIEAMYPHLSAGMKPEERFRSLLAEYGISAREAEVVRLICRGMTNKEIEAALFISMPTVKDHVSNIFRKTGAANRVQLAALFHFRED